MPARLTAPRHRSSAPQAFFVAIVTTLGLACSSVANTGFVGAPAVVIAFAGDASNSTVGTAIGPFVAKVTDTAGTVIPNVAVTFTASPGLTITPTSGTTNEDGTAFTAGTFGLVAGTYTVTATAAGISTPAVFHTTAFPEVASVISSSGNNQSAPAGNALDEPLQVFVTDKYGNPIQGIVISWAAASGTLVGAQGHTDASGRAAATYTLPLTKGLSSVVVTTSLGSTPTTVTFTETGT
jgi:adhesin/invasin